MHSLLAPLVALAFSGPATPVQAGLPRVDGPRPVARGTYQADWWIKESDVAAGGGYAFAAFMHGSPLPNTTSAFSPVQIRYAFFDGESWSEGLVDGEDAVAADPSVVWNPLDRTFCVTYFRTDGLDPSQDGEKPVYARVFDPRRRGFLADRPRLVLPNPQNGGFYDKPWIVTGRMAPECHELVVTAFFAQGIGTATLSYARSRDGGLSWEEGAAVDPSGTAITTSFAPQPAIPDALPGAPLYTVLRTGTRWTFWQNDDPCGSTLPGEFRGLGVAHNPVAASEFINTKVPGTGKMVRVPYLVSDPTSRDRLFVVFTDVPPGASSNAGDMDVYCLRLERDPATGTWSKSAPVRVNDNPVGDGTDQFTPAAVVDAAGRVHVIFYDGRRYASGLVPAPCNAPGPKYDATYAWSEDGGRSFRNIRLETGNDEPVLCDDLPAAMQPPGEYPGIAVSGSEVWAAFAGTSHRDESADRSVLWATRVRFPEAATARAPR